MALAAAPAAAAASSWPVIGGSPARAGVQLADAGGLPASRAWSFAEEDGATPAIITGGDGPARQRVVYGTTDGRVHFRSLSDGTAVGPADGVQVADATVTDPDRALASGFVSTSTDTAPGVTLVVHDDGGGVEIARFDEATGTRSGADVSVPGSFGCEEAGAPLLTPVAADGSRLLFFTMAGACPAGEGLVRYGLRADGEFVRPAVAPVRGVVAAPPALTVIDGAFHVAVPRAGGVDFRRADGVYGAAPEFAVDLGPSQTPVALAATPHALFVLAQEGLEASVDRVALGTSPRMADAVRMTGQAAGFAVGDGRIAVATDAALTVLGDDLALVGTVAGAATAPSIEGGVAYSAGRAVRLADATATTLPAAPGVAPAIARGYVVFESTALRTRDLTPPTIAFTHGHRAATVADDRGVLAVVFKVGGRTEPAQTGGSAWAPARYRPFLGGLAPGRSTFRVLARDYAGNLARARAALRVPCDRTLRGSQHGDVLRGRRGKDCLVGRGGPDRLLTRGGGADRVRCGPGRDLVRADARDRVADDCERIRRRGP